MILRWLPKAIANRDSQIEHIAKDNPIAAISQDLWRTHGSSANLFIDMQWYQPFA